MHLLATWLLVSASIFAALLPEAFVCLGESVEHNDDASPDPAGTEAASASEQLSRTRRYATPRSRKINQAGRLQFTRANISLSQQFRFLTKFGPYIVKLHLYLDREFEKRTNRNQAEMSSIAKQVVNYANTLLRPLNTYLMVTSLHLPWNPLARNYDIPSRNELKFIRDTYTYNNYGFIVEQIVNCIFVFTARSIDNSTASDSEGNVCKHQLGRPTCLGYVTLDTKRPNYIKLSGFALAHELVHRLGGNHDSVDKCQCKFSQCLMDDSVGRSNDGSKYVGWTNCGINKVADALDSLALDAACLSATAEPFSSTNGYIFTVEYSMDWGPTCGNGIVEPGEECDCGGPLACRKDRCCQADACKLVKGAACATGDCCNTTSCSPLAAGTLCRLAEDPRCNFPEFCDGKSPICPQVVSVQSNWPCDRPTGSRCRMGHCVMLPNYFAQYSGMKCVNSDMVPTTAGECKRRHRPGPAEKIEDWVDDGSGDQPIDESNGNMASFHRPLAEEVNQAARQSIGGLLLSAASLATTAAVFYWRR